MVLPAPPSDHLVKFPFLSMIVLRVEFFFMRRVSFSFTTIARSPFLRRFRCLLFLFTCLHVILFNLRPTDAWVYSTRGERCGTFLPGTPTHIFLSLPIFKHTVPCRDMLVTFALLLLHLFFFCNTLLGLVVWAVPFSGAQQLCKRASFGLGH